MNIKEIKNVDKVKKINEMSHEEIVKLSKKVKKAVLIVVGSLTITSLAGCSSCSKTEEAVVEETVAEITEEEALVEETPEVEEVLEADEEIYKLQDDAVIAANNALKVGIDLSYDHVVDENDIDTYATQFTNYIIVANMDTYNDKLFAEMMTDSNVSSEDLIDSFMNLNTAFKKHLITVTSDNLYDFNNLYAKEDAEVLNHAQELIATMNENELKSDERKEAAKEFYTYATEIINSTNARMAISPQALDTLVTFIEAYDELTFNYRSSKVKGAYVDDELEHALNISKESCFGVAENDLNVQDKVVENFKSLFRTHILKDLNTKYEAAKEERALQLQLGNTLNELNSYESIVTYVKDHLKIDLYEALEYDYQTWLKVLKGVITSTNGQKLTSNKLSQSTGSGISDGQGGVISAQQLKEYGISTEGKKPEQVRQELEKAVEDKENQKTEQNKVVTTTNQTGKVVPADGNSNIESVNGSVADVQNGYAAGYADGQNFSNNCPSSASDAYKAAYNNGYAAGEANAKAMQEKYSDTQTTYETVTNGTTTTQETITTQDYTSNPAPATVNPQTTTNTETNTGSVNITIENNTSNNNAPVYVNSNGDIINELPQAGESFEPIDEEIINETESFETIGYSSKANALSELIQYRNMLMALSNTHTNDSFSRRI